MTDGLSFSRAGIAKGRTVNSSLSKDVFWRWQSESLVKGRSSQHIVGGTKQVCSPFYFLFNTDHSQSHFFAHIRKPNLIKIYQLIQQYQLPSATVLCAFFHLSRSTQHSFGIVLLFTFIMLILTLLLALSCSSPAPNWIPHHHSTVEFIRAFSQKQLLAAGNQADEIVKLKQ